MDTVKDTEVELLVKNAEGDSDTKATIIYQNSIDYEPKVSVIIPVYNIEKYLRECLDSVVNQTLKEIEIICIDDGSTDSSLKILKEYAQKDNRLTVFHVAHSGTGICRNLGIKNAIGSYIGFIDPDDWIELSYFEKLYNETLNDSPEIVFQTERIEVNNISKKQTKIGTPIGQNDIEFRFNIIDKSAHLWSKIFKKEFVEEYKIRNYTSKRSQDLLFTIPAVLLADNIKCINNAEYYYRKGHHSACQVNWTLQDAIESLNLYDEIRKKLTNFNTNYISLVNLKENILCKKIQHELSEKDLIEFNNIVDKLHFIDFKTNVQERDDITIKNPASDDIAKIWWGDYWLGLDLASGLKEEGYNVKIDYSNDFENENKDNINIVIRGLKKFNNIDKRKINILYLISNPDLVTKKEIKQYDIVFCCSEKYTEKIKKYNKNTYFLPQFTNLNRFYNEQNDKYKNKVLYVGNAHRGMRPAVEYAINSNQPISIYGNFWDKLIDKKYIKGLYIDNNELHKYYSNADIVLNDTMPNMRDLGFISNRIYDVAACKGFIISDYMPEIKKIFGDTIPMYKNQKELKELIEYYLAHPEERKEKAQKAYNIVINNYSNSKIAEIIKLYIYKQKYITYKKKLYHLTQNIFSIKNEPIRKQHKIITILGLKIKVKRNCLEKIFSIRNDNIRKVITILGLKFKFKSKKLVERKQQEEMRNSINHLIEQNNILNNKLTEQNKKIDEQNQRLKEQENKLEKEINNLKQDFNQKLNTEKSKLIYKLHKYIPEEKRPEALKDWYFERTGETLNLENPQTFNEKIQWLKLYDSTSIKTQLTDKYLVRDWVKEKIGEEYLIPLLGVYDSFDEIDFDKLPNQFVIKCNHGSGYNIIVTDKSQFNKKEARKKISNWMNEDFTFRAGFEMHYSDIPRKIIAEKYIQPEISDIEIQSWCFGGELKFISYETCKDAKNAYRAIFTPDWELENFMISPQHYSKFSTLPQKPKYLEELKNIVSILCKDFKHVRIDFIIVEDRLYFREMTFTSASGLSKFEPEETKYLLGEIIKLSSFDD